MVNRTGLLGLAFLASVVVLVACTGLGNAPLPQVASSAGSAPAFQQSSLRHHDASPFTLIAPLVIASAPASSGGGSGSGGLLKRRDKPGSGDTGPFASGNYVFNYEYQTYHDECEQQHHQDPVLDPDNSGAMGIVGESLPELCRDEDGTGSLPAGQTATALYIIGIQRNEGDNGNPIQPTDSVTPLMGPAQLIDGNLVFPAPSNGSYPIDDATQYYFYLALDRDSTDPLPHP